MKYLFGPVNSRRLGISLGIDLVPYKTCTLNCVYCECGGTTTFTSRRAEYVPTDAVIGELNEYLQAGPKLDTLTFSGSGEPTLHSGIGTVIDYLKKEYSQYTVTVLTNGTLFWQKEVRDNILNADIVVPSLDAGSEKVFSQIVRPIAGITFERHLNGMIAFRNEYHGIMNIEVFIISGLNDSETELEKIKNAIEKIRPDRVQLNRLDRPGTEDWVQQVSSERMCAIRDYFLPIPVDIISDPNRKIHCESTANNHRERILMTLERRPSTIDDLDAMLSIPKNTLQDILRKLLKSGKVIEKKLERGIFYYPKK